MPLSLFHGSFPDLEAALQAHLAGHPPGVGRPVAIVTGSQRMAERLQRMLTLERGQSYFNLRFHTFHSLAVEVLRTGGVPLPHIINDDLFHERMVERLLIDTKKMPPDRARALAGAHRATLRDLVEAGVDTESFRAHFSDMEIPGEAKLQRLLSLADRYRERLTQINVATTSDLARRATQSLDQNPGALPAFDEFLYYGFYDLNGAQTDFLSAVARAATVRVFFPWVKGHGGWAFAQRFLESNLSAGGPATPVKEAGSPCALGAGFKGLFDPSLPPEKPTGEVRLIHVSGERDELWRVAKEILAIRKKRKVPWEEIGVVARGLEPYAGFVPDVFGSHGIPYSISDGGPLHAHPAARLALNLLQLPFQDHDREALLEIVQSPCLSEEVLAAPSRALAQRYLIQAGPRAGLAHLLRGSSLAGPEIPSELRAPVSPDMLRAFAERFRPDGASAPRAWSEQADRAGHRWDAMILRNPETEPILQSLHEIRERLKDLDRFSPPVSEEEFLRAVGEALRRARRPGTGPSRGVRVLSAMEARGERFSTLFLIGLKEGVFPRGVREDPLLGDSLRKVLRDPGGYWILPKLEGYDEEKLLFSLLASSAEDWLALLYSRSREDGRAEVPSLYLRELARAVGIPFEEAERLPRPPLAKWSAVPAVGLTPLEAGLADLLGGGRLSGEWGALAKRAQQITSWAAPTAVDGLVGPPEAYLARAATRGLSPSSLEIWGSCPFEFFASRVLSIRAPRALYTVEGLSPAVLGRLQHLLLQRVYAGFLDREAPPPAEGAERVRQETRRLFDALETLSAAPYPLLWRVLRDQVESQLVAFVERDLARLAQEGFRPERLEWALTAPAPRPPLLWSGRLDRVDWNPTNRQFRVVDYKNKSRDHSLVDRVLDGVVHQAPVYLALVEAQGTWTPSAETLGVRYEYLANNETEEFPASVWREKREALVAVQERLIDDLSAGRFLIQPSEGPQGHCHFCDFARACRKAHGPTRARAEQGRQSSTPSTSP